MSISRSSGLRCQGHRIMGREGVWKVVSFPSVNSTSGAEESAGDLLYCGGVICHAPLLPPSKSFAIKNKCQKKPYLSHVDRVSKKNNSGDSFEMLLWPGPVQDISQSG